MYHEGPNVFGVGYLPAVEADLQDILDASPKNNVSCLVDAYRRFGYLDADIDPLRIFPRKRFFRHLFSLISVFKCSRFRELDPSFYEFDSMSNLIDDTASVTVCDLVNDLKMKYCGKIAVEFMHLTVNCFKNFPSIHILI